MLSCFAALLSFAACLLGFLCGELYKLLRQPRRRWTVGAMRRRHARSNGLLPGRPHAHAATQFDQHRCGAGRAVADAAAPCRSSGREHITGSAMSETHEGDPAVAAAAATATAAAAGSGHAPRSQAVAPDAMSASPAGALVTGHSCSLLDLPGPAASKVPRDAEGSAGLRACQNDQICQNDALHCALL